MSSATPLVIGIAVATLGAAVGILGSYRRAQSPAQRRQVVGVGIGLVVSSAAFLLTAL